MSDPAVVETPETEPTNPLSNELGLYEADSLDALLGTGAFRGTPVRAEDPDPETDPNPEAPEAPSPEDPPADEPPTEELPAAPEAPQTPETPSAREQALAQQVAALQAQVGAMLSSAPKTPKPAAEPVRVEVPPITEEAMNEALSSPEAFRALLQGVADRAVEAARTERQQALPEAIRAEQAKVSSTTDAAASWREANVDLYKPVAEGGLGLKVPFVRLVQAAEEAGRLSEDPEQLHQQLNQLREFVIQQAEEYRGTLAAPTPKQQESRPKGRALPVPAGGGSRRTVGAAPSASPSTPDTLLGMRLVI